MSLIYEVDTDSEVPIIYSGKPFWVSSNSKLLTGDGLVSVFDIKHGSYISCVLLKVLQGNEKGVEVEVIDDSIKIGKTRKGSLMLEDWKLVSYNGVLSENPSFLSANSYEEEEIETLTPSPRQGNSIRCNFGCRLRRECIFEIIHRNIITLERIQSKPLVTSVYNHKQLVNLTFSVDPDMIMYGKVKQKNLFYLTIPIFPYNSDEKGILHNIYNFRGTDFTYNMPRIPLEKLQRCAVSADGDNTSLNKMVYKKSEDEFCDEFLDYDPIAISPTDEVVSTPPGPVYGLTSFQTLMDTSVFDKMIYDLNKTINSSDEDSDGSSTDEEPSYQSFTAMVRYTKKDDGLVYPDEEEEDDN